MAIAPASSGTHEIICDHRSAAGPSVLRVRGSLIASSLSALRELGYYERYLALLDNQVREPILSTLAMSWVPVELALAHYQTCDALRMGESDLERIGQHVAQRHADVFFGTLMRTIRAAGIDAPWAGLRAQPRVWDRIYEGGGLTVFRLGPKDAVLELHGLPLVRYVYFLNAYAGYLRGLASLLVRRFYLKLIEPQSGQPNSVAFAGSWV